MWWLKLRKRLGFVASSLQAISSVLLLGASTLLISKAATHVPIMMLMTLVVMVRAFAIGRAGFRYTERLLLHDSAFKLLQSLRVRVFKKLEPIAPLGLRRFGRGDLVARLVDDVDELQNLQLRVLPGLVQSVVATALVSGIVLWLLPSLGLAFLALMYSSFAAALIVGYLTGSAGQALVSTQRAALYSSLIDASERADLFMAFGWAEGVERSISQQSAELVKIEKRAARASGLAGSVLVIGLAISQLVAALLGAQAVQAGALDRVYLASLVLLPVVVFEFFQLELPAISAYRRYRASKLRIDEVLALEPAKPSGVKELGPFQSLSCSNASVRFEDGFELKLPDLTLSKNSSLALVGRSGSGKSTLANVLVGFLPSNGGVLLNGLPIDDYAHGSLRKEIGLVEQNSSVLIGTVEANLRIAKPQASDCELIEVLAKVGLWQALELRDGLATEVGENGKFLSGGEVSRLGLARVLLSGRNLVILDEPTAALDRDLAHRLVSELVSASQAEGKSVILITHDPDLVVYCDQAVNISPTVR